MRMEFVYNHPEKFESVIIPIMTCLLKFIVEFGTEVLQIYVAFCTEDNLNIVLSFTALTIISNTDELYFGSIVHPLKDTMLDSGLKIKFKKK